MIYALIAMAGGGTRLNSSTPKQFLKLNGRELFLYSLDKFFNNKNVDKIILVIPKGYQDFVSNLIEENHIDKVSQIIIGGSTRQESIRLALNQIVVNDNDLILIHDAARIFVTDEIINENINVAKSYGNAITAIDAVDSLFDTKNNQYLDRSKIKNIQTPQTFNFKLIKDLHNLYRNEIVTDDASLLIKNNLKMHFVNGSGSNIKITTADDFNLASKILK